jgi:hypothetical protein
MERTLNIDLRAARFGYRAKSRNGVKLFAASVIICACLSAALASWLPLQLSVVTVFLFAGPHNWFELCYFLMRLPVRFGKSRNFFVAAFAGIGLLTAGYVALPLLYNFTSWSSDAWSMVIASWNTLLLSWLALLVWLRGKNKRRPDWSWAIPVALVLCSLNWLAPELFSLAIVYLHPLVALWFLDRHLRRTRPEWLRTYHQCLVLVAMLLTGIVFRLTQTPALLDDNGLFWRITQHSGAQLLPGVSSHLLVSVHVFLEMLHYGVWIVALPLIVPATIRARQKRNRVWEVKTVPLARHPRGFPKLVGAALLLGLFVVAVLWLGFSVDYSTTRDIYFTVAIAHVLAEAPFLLKML